ncbi:MAG: thiolase family protein [Deltaproteobacteria bacterium]|nr:thiolase family protein [Deltaproteobacteria bacterium]
MDKFQGKVAIVGTGEVPTGKFPERPALQHALESCKMAIEDAGISKDEIDTVMACGVIFNARYGRDLGVGLLADELGLCGKVKRNFMLFSGGSSSSDMLELAVAMVGQGFSKTVLISHSEKLAVSSDAFGRVDDPFGMGMNTIMGLITQRYIHETGTTPEQLASVCVSNRKWAQLNPNARFQKPLTIEDVLKSKMITTPLHAMECNILCDGGSALIVTSDERAKDLRNPPVYPLGFGSVVTHFNATYAPDMAALSYPQVAKEAYEMAGIGPEDVDIAELYDSYPVISLIALEGLGLCKKGEAGRFVYEGHTWPGGSLPMTTNGGMLSQGHTGGGGSFAILVEAVRQLMGKAGDRQVKDAKIAVETSTGGYYADTHMMVLGKEKP